MKPTAPPVTERFIEFPLRLISGLSELRLADDIWVRPIDNGARKRILGIERVELDENVRIKSIVSTNPNPFGFGHEIDHYDQLYSSNYVVLVPTHEDAVHLNFILKLFAPSCSSLFIGHEQPDTKHFISPPCYYGDSPLTIREPAIAVLSDLLALKRRTKSPKLDLMAEKFLYAMSTAPRKESRFVELSIILEMLLLPTNSTELSYRFALRMAKFLARHWGADPAESFKVGQQIYKTRSKLVHTGRDDAIDDTLPKTEEMVRKLLTKYLSNPELFEDNALDNLCVAV